MQPKQDMMFTNTKGTRSRAAPVVVVNRIGFASVVSFTRPNNVTPYQAKDVVGKPDSVTQANAGSSILELADIGPAGGSIVLTGTDLRMDRADVPAGMGSFTAHLYDAAPAEQLDGATFSMTPDAAKYLGSIDLGAPAVVGGALFVQKDNLSKQVKLAEGSTSLWVRIVTEAAYTPNALTNHNLRVQSRNA